MEIGKLMQNDPTKSSQPRGSPVRTGKATQDTCSTELSCLVCDQIAEQVFRFLARIQYELSNSNHEQQEHATRGGFCAMHTWQYERLASPQGICTAYTSVLRALAMKLRSSAEARILDAALVPDRKRCAACRIAAKAEEEGVQFLCPPAGLAKLGEEPSFPNLCLAHLHMVVERVPDPRAVESLLSHAAGVLDQLADRMEQFNQKREKRLEAPITEDDWAAPRQAMALLVGHRKVQPANESILRPSEVSQRD
jgi:hypothetical protein